MSAVAPVCLLLMEGGVDLEETNLEARGELPLEMLAKRPAKGEKLRKVWAPQSTRGVVEVGAQESGLRVDLHPSVVGDACRVCACRGLDTRSLGRLRRRGATARALTERSRLTHRKLRRAVPLLRPLPLTDLPGSGGLCAGWLLRRARRRAYGRRRCAQRRHPSCVNGRITAAAPNLRILNRRLRITSEICR
jgi:hypothetical protein